MKHHSQTRIASLVESLVSNAIGFFLTVLAQWFLFKNQPLSENLTFSAVLLVLHIIRSYVVRRGFNAYVMHRAKLAKKRKQAERAAKRSANKKLKLKKIHEQKTEEPRALQQHDTPSGV